MYFLSGAASVRRLGKRLAAAFGVMTALAAVFFLAACSSGTSNADKTATAGAGRPTTAAGAPTSAPANDSLLGYKACPPSGAATALTGAGGTFIFPLMSKWVDDYEKSCHVQVNYQSVGSGAGINQITQKTVDFGESDAILTDQQDAAATAAGGPILHIPMTSGAEAIIFNLPGIQRSQLKLSGDVPGQHLPAQHQEVERPPDCGPQPRPQPAEHRHRRRPPLGWLRHDLHLHKLPLEGEL